LYSANRHAEQTPCSSKVMRGRWFEIVHFLQNLTVGGSLYRPIKSRFFIFRRRDISG
jgi:hypothetical protein